MSEQILLEKSSYLSDRQSLVAQTERAQIKIQQLEDALSYTRKALGCIALALKEPSGGSYNPARRFLDDAEIFNDDLSGERVLLRVAVTALEKTK